MMAARATTRKAVTRVTRKAPRRRNSVAWEDDDASLVSQAQTSRSAEELARLHKYAVSHRDSKLKAAVDKRAKQLGVKPAELKWNPKYAALPDFVLYDGPSHAQAIEALKRAITGGRYIGLKMRGKGGNWKVTADSIRQNPAAASAEVYEEFHGVPPNEIVKVTQKVHRHRFLAAAGDLVGMEVKPINRGPVRRIEGLGEAILAFNEKKNQLFIRGGDQRMSPAELEKFGISDEHELQTLGKLVGVGYYTDKKHLGDEGGLAVYSHIFRTTNEHGAHVTVTIARYPDLIYRVLDEQFEISGGSYEILREGIDK